MPSSRIHNNLPLESFSLLKVNYDVFNMLTNKQTRNLLLLLLSYQTIRIDNFHENVTSSLNHYMPRELSHDCTSHLSTLILVLHFNSTK